MNTCFDKIKEDIDLIKNLSVFKNEFNIENISILLVNKNKVFFIEELCSNNNSINSKFPSTLDNNNLISLACEKNKPIYFYEENDIIYPLNKNFVEELCLPIKLEQNKDITVCIYFGFIKKTKNIQALLSSFLDRFNIFEIYSYVYSKYIQLSETEKIKKLLMLLEDIIETHHPSMRLHGFNVAFWATEIGKKLNFSKDELEKIYLAALFHDIGKLRIPESIINKQGPLANEEYEEVKKHVEFSYIITKEFFEDLYPEIPLWVRAHHEMYDGSGYPFGLKGNEIPLVSRILKVADVIDVLYSPRSYKKNLPIDKIITELKNCSGKDFDPSVVEAALNVIDEKIILPMDILKLKSGQILPANLSLRTYNEIFNLEGYFSNNDEKYYFKSTNTIKTSKDLWNLVSASLVVEILNSIYEYEVNALPLDENTYQITEIRPLERKSYVSILWDLDGNLILQDNKSINIKVKKLSADDLLFVNGDNSNLTINLNNLYKIKLKF
ncbi:MAG: HD-GYP domain-containing protein [Thermovenabulum sp.]|uniref:HD-GYP domain-containing protein n=1 Tax=Thermovenabulum sp. TaxID=3100335 RepID=UPI003C79D1C1